MIRLTNKQLPITLRYATIQFKQIICIIITNFIYSMLQLLLRAINTPRLAFTTHIA